MNITNETHPALWQLLYGIHDVRTDADGKPSFCDGCHFAELDTTKNQHHEIANDPTEAYYKCKLLGTVVWGENPKCDRENWTRRACQELGLPINGPESRHD